MSSGAAVFVLGPAGSGKSTFCTAMLQQCESIGRSAHLFNLDPAAESFEYAPSKDIRDLIRVEDVMEELDLGPNGGLVYSLEFLLDHPEWLESDLGHYTDEFIMVDCPGQIELYTHFTIMTEIIAMFQQADYRVCVVYLMESLFLQDVTKYFAGVLNATSAMLQLGVPHLNLISKMDLLSKRTGDGKFMIDSFKSRTAKSKCHGEKSNKEMDTLYGNDNDENKDAGDNDGDNDDYDDGSSDMDNCVEENHRLYRYFYPDPSLLAEQLSSHTKPKYYRLNDALVRLLDDYDMASFVPLDVKKEGSLELILSLIDHATQFAEGLEPKEPKDNVEDGDDD